MFSGADVIGFDVHLNRGTKYTSKGRNGTEKYQHRTRPFTSFNSSFRLHTRHYWSKMCKLGFKKVIVGSGLTCADVALHYVSSKCSFVELHHYDVSMLPVFERARFEPILFMRDPIDLWVSW